MTWHLEPSTFGLYGGITPSTLVGFAEQQWPPCPVCGTTIDVDAICVPTQDDPEVLYIMGQWHCPRGCDPKRRPRGELPELGEPFRYGSAANRSPCECRGTQLGAVERRGQMIVYVTVCEDNQIDPVVRVHEHPESGRLAVQEWAEDSIDNGDPIDYEDHDGEDDGIILIVTIGEGTAYEGRYQATMYRCEVEFAITRPILSSEQR